MTGKNGHSCYYIQGSEIIHIYIKQEILFESKEDFGLKLQNLKVSATRKERRMKVFAILLIFFVLSANSISRKIANPITGNLGINGSLRPIVNEILCRIKTIVDNTADQIQSACADLPDASDATVAGAQITCKAAIRILNSLSNALAKYCQDVTTNSPTTTTTTERPKTCEELYPGYTDACTESCLNNRYIYLGGECILYPGGAVSCSCTSVTNCENYQNTTCQSQCRKKSSNGYCRIPERNIDCACRFRTRVNTTYYERP